ncbi:MAG: carboxypeptidase regulatory-like domain-containing protein, partial [Muribaculaceae bacterium]|nr:carboxypeptidase regulatory-like domain-containing protein [Muribaculaceae bacterium]
MKLSHGGANVAAYGFYNSSRAYYTTTYYGSEDINPGWGGVGFMTHYIEMGAEPEISFWYQMANVDFSGNVVGAAESSKVEVYVQVSEDGGNTFDTVYTVEPGGEHEHTATLDFTNIKLAVPQYAGKTCRVRVVFNQPGGGSFFNQVRVLADDVSVGTKSKVDLQATSLLGETLLLAGSQYELKATVKNLGIESASDYKVELIDLISGDKIAEVEGVEVKPSGSSEVKFFWKAENPGPVKLQARIVSDSDPVADNNNSYAYIAQILPQDNTAISVNHGETLKAMSYPINFYAVESMTQSIFPANEIGTTAGQINSLVFTSCLDADFYGESFTVFIGETDKSDYSEVSMVDPASLTKVFDGAIYMEAGVRDLVIPFDEPYNYRGGNLVVMCQKLGKEFVMGQYFIIHRTKEVYRSIQATTYSQGTLVESGYEGLINSDAYPEIRFNMVKAPSGKVSGKVSDAVGPVSGAQVRVAGTQRTEITDAEGKYTFAEIGEGTIALEVSKHDYYVFNGDSFALQADASEVKDIVLTRLPRYSLQGTVSSQTTGEPIKNARIQLRGYDDYVVMTDDAGHYIVADMAGDCGEEYDVQVTNGYFHPQNSSVDVDADKTLDFVLKEKNLRAHNVKATKTASGNLVTWEEPMPEFRYDSGEPTDYIGWTHGSSEVIVGVAFYKKAKIKEISWYTTNRYGNHQNFNVFIFGLDSEGKSDVENLLYKAR